MQIYVPFDERALAGHIEIVRFDVLGLDLAQDIHERLVDERLDIYLVIQFLVGQFALRPFESLQKRPPVVQIVYIQMEHAADALGIGILERDVLHGEDVIFEAVLCLRRFRVRRGRTDDDQIAFAERLRTAV